MYVCVCICIYIHHMHTHVYTRMQLFSMTEKSPCILTFLLSCVDTYRRGSRFIVGCKNPTDW